MTIRLLLVDDHPALREGLAVVLGQQRDLEVVAQAGTLADAVAGFRRVRPDVVLLDLRLPDGNGAELCARLRGEDAQARLVVLSTFDSLEDRFRAFQAGAAAYLRKDASAVQIAAALRAVHEGRRLLHDDVAELLRAPRLKVALSPRELAVLRLVAAGQNNKQVGAALGISAETVKTLLERAREKMGARDRTEAVALAIRLGLLEP